MADKQLHIIKQINVDSDSPYDIAAKYDGNKQEISTTYMTKDEAALLTTVQIVTWEADD